MVVHGDVLPFDEPLLSGTIPRKAEQFLTEKTGFFRQDFLGFSTKTPCVLWINVIKFRLNNYGNTAGWELWASADLLPQSCRMKNGKYILYSRIFHTLAGVKTLAQSPCPIMRRCPKNEIILQTFCKKEGVFFLLFALFPQGVKKGDKSMLS